MKEQVGADMVGNQSKNGPCCKLCEFKSLYGLIQPDGDACAGTKEVSNGRARDLRMIFSLQI